MEVKPVCPKRSSAHTMSIAATNLATPCQHARSDLRCQTRAHEHRQFQVHSRDLISAVVLRGRRSSGASSCLVVAGDRYLTLSSNRITIDCVEKSKSTVFIVRSPLSPSPSPFPRSMSWFTANGKEDVIVKGAVHLTYGIPMLSAPKALVGDPGARHAVRSSSEL